MNHSEGGLKILLVQKKRGFNAMLFTDCAPSTDFYGAETPEGD